MAEVEFNYEGSNTIIQCPLNEKMKDVIQRFKNKVLKNGDFIFLYGGSQIKEELTFEEQANTLDKQRKKMSIIVNYKDDILVQKNLKKSKYIICPKCQESALMEIEDFKIAFNCINEHKTEGILFSELENTQNIDESKIICELCENSNKSITFNNKFYRCLICQKNMCPICKNAHDKTHKIIDYDEKDFICNLHYDLYNSFCNQCNKNICLLCEKDHKEHKILSFSEIIPETQKINDNMKELKIIIDKVKNNIKDIILILNKFMDQLEIFYKIYDNIFKNYEYKNRNAFNLLNTCLAYKSSVELLDLLITINQNKKIENKFEKIIDLYNDMTIKKNINIEKDTIIEEKNKEINNFQELDKYENFNIKNIKELTTFKSEYANSQIIILKDWRILSHNSYRGSFPFETILGKHPKPRVLSVYSIKNNKINCDIIFETRRIYDMIQMDDGYVIIVQYDQFGVLDIKEKEIVIKQVKDDKDHKYYNLYKLSSTKFMTVTSDKTLHKDISILTIFSYENGKILDDKYIIILEIKIDTICVTNENTIAICYEEKGKLFGYNSYILFYDIKKDKQIYSFKFDGSHYLSVFTFNVDYLIVFKINKKTAKQKIILLDKKNNRIEGELSLEDYFDMLIPLNDKSFLTLKLQNIISQFEIKNKNSFQLKGTKEMKEVNFIGRYPGNKLIINELLDIGIYN